MTSFRRSCSAASVDRSHTFDHVGPCNGGILSHVFVSPGSGCVTVYSHIVASTSTVTVLIVFFVFSLVSLYVSNNYYYYLARLDVCSKPFIYNRCLGENEYYYIGLGRPYLSTGQ